MLRITVDVLPLGDAEHPERLGTLDIVNDGSGTLETGNYSLFTVDGEGVPILRAGTVTGFTRSRSFWDLLALALIENRKWRLLVDAMRDIPAGPDLDRIISKDVMKFSLKEKDYCPAYSTDPLEALGILTELKKRGRSIALRWWPPHEVPGHPDGLWTCHLGIGSYDVAGETMAHAICLAALVD